MFVYLLNNQLSSLFTNNQFHIFWLFRNNKTVMWLFLNNSPCFGYIQITTLNNKNTQATPQAQKQRFSKFIPEETHSS